MEDEREGIVARGTISVGGGKSDGSGKLNAAQRRPCGLMAPFLRRQ